MGFPFSIYLLAFIAAFATTWTTLPFWSKICRRLGIIDDPGHRKIHLLPTPLSGGPAVLGGILLPLLCGVTLYLLAPALLHLLGVGTLLPLSHGLDRRQNELLVLLAGCLGMTLLGLADDRFELTPSVKLTGQVIIALATAAAGLRITLFVPSLWFSYGVTVFWILAVTNAINILDNMNGLCSGLGIVTLWGCGWIAASHGQYLVAILAFLASGSLAGFFPHNFPRGTAFLGDAGSHLVGYLVSVMAILPHYYSSSDPVLSPWAVLTPLFLLAIPLGDLAYVVWLRWRMGKPIYIGDTNHISHRLVRRGFTKTTAVLLILAAAAITTWMGALFAGKR